jgi:hypothetical protein
MQKSSVAKRRHKGSRAVTPIKNKAKEVRAWIERQQPMAWDGKGSPGVSRIEIARYVKARWPDLAPTIQFSIIEASI